MLITKNLDEIIKSNKISHAYIFNSQNMNEALVLAKDFILQIVKQNESKSIDNDILFSEKVCIIEPTNATIKKEQIISLQKQMSTKAIGKRFYIVKDAEKLNDSAVNSILKFLEEPEEDLVAIFLTKNYLVLPETIKSRCQLILISEEKDTISKENLISQIVNRQGITIEKDKLNMYYVNMEKFVKSIYEKKIETLVEAKSLFNDNISTREELSANLHILLFIYQEYYNKKYKEKNNVIEINNEIYEWLTKQRYLSILNVILSNVNLVDSNVNQKSIVDKLIIELSEVN